MCGTTYLFVYLIINKLFSAVKWLIAINHIQNKSLQNICVYCVYLLCLYKYTHIHVYI